MSNSGVVKFLKEQDFKGSFLHDYITPLIEFVTTLDNPEHEFLDPELEEQRKKLFISAKQLANTIGNKTTFINGSVQSVKPNHLQSGPIPDWVLKDGEEINEAADAFTNKHEEFIRFAKKKLYS